MRLLHCADLHLDRTFAFLGHDSRNRPSIRRQDLRNTLASLVDTAVELGADALCIAGDLYEHDRASADLAAFLRHQFGRCPGLRVCISPGNHDPYHISSLYRQNEWPANVHVFRQEEFEPLELGPGFTLWGAAFHAPDRHSTPFQSFICPGDGTHLALVHGALQQSGSRQFSQGYAPFSGQELRACGFDFVMLGHYHSPCEALDEPHPFAYSGSPARFTFEEESPQRALLVEVDGSVRVQAVPMPGRRYVSPAYDLSGDATVSELIEGIGRLAAQDGEWRQACVDLTLRGQRQSSLAISSPALPSLLEEALGSFFVRVKDRSGWAHDVDALALELTTRGEFVRRMRSRLAACQNEVERTRLEQALSCGLQAFAALEVSLV